MSGHTATLGLWRTSIDEEADELYIVGPAGGVIAEMIRGLSAKDDAALIVTACNSHADLVKALEDLDAVLDFSDENLGSVWTFDDLTAVRAAFKQATAALATLTARKVG